MIKAVLFDYGRVLYGPIFPHRKVRKLAKELRRQGFKTGILSNIFLTAAWFLNLVGAYRGFDPIILSFKEKIAKPNAGIYEIAIERLNVRPEEIIFVDNLEENIVTAEKLGMKAVLAKSSDQVIEDIKKILLRENNLKL
ncbi:MAG TPA: HAD-IA family hydrolase [Candidatus Saccharimonadales bacterium]|nr:HAD-IA family hydrolase [Candidatus Saccharimonadales bacterium]